eukprot:gene22058-56297_t
MCRKVYFSEECNEEDASTWTMFPAKWVCDAPMSSLEGALSWNSFLHRYPQLTLPPNSGPKRLGLQELSQLSSEIIDGTPMMDAYVDLRPYMDEQPYSCLHEGHHVPIQMLDAAAGPIEAGIG